MVDKNQEGKKRQTDLGYSRNTKRMTVVICKCREWDRRSKNKEYSLPVFWFKERKKGRKNKGQQEERCIHRNKQSEMEKEKEKEKKKDGR